MDWLKFAEQYGLASAGLAFVFWYVVLPLKDRHVKFLDSTEETNKSLAKIGRETGGNTGRNADWSFQDE